MKGVDLYTPTQSLVPSAAGKGLLLRVVDCIVDRVACKLGTIACWEIY